MATIIESDPAEFVHNDGYAASSESEEESTLLSSPTNNKIPIEERIKHHAKRPSKSLANVVATNDASPPDVNIKKFMKNSRRSRTRFGRGLTKKGIQIQYF